MKNSELPANSWNPSRPRDDESAYGFGGLTKREYFAGLAMQSIISNADTMREITKAFDRVSNSGSDSLEFGKAIGRLSLMYADGLLEEL